MSSVASVLRRLQLLTEELSAAHRRVWALTDAGLWDDVVLAGGQALGLSQDAVYRVGAVSQLIDANLHVPAVSDIAARVFGEERLGDPARRSELRQQILDAATAEGLPLGASDIDSFLDGETGSRLAAGLAALTATEGERVASVSAQLAADSFVGQVTAAGNLAFSSLAGDSRVLSTVTRQRVDRLASDVEIAREIGLCAVYDLLVGGEAASQVSAAAYRLAADLQSRAEVVGATLGGGVVLLNQTGSTVSLGRSLARLRSAARLAAVAVAFATLVQVRLAGAGSGRFLSAERRRARGRSFDSVTPTGRPAGTAEIATAAAAELLSVEGWVEGLHTVDDPSPPKFSTLFTLRRGMEAVRVRAHMFNLENNGLRDGAYTVVHGTADATGAEPVINVDRVALTSQRRASWLDDITYRMRFAFWVFLDEMNMDFTPSYAEVV